MSRPNAQSMKPATAAKKLDVYLPATPAEFQENPITRDELAALQADPPQWLKDLRKNGPHPKNLVAAKLGVSIAGLARGGVTDALTTEQINQLLEEKPEWLVAERESFQSVLREERRLKALQAEQGRQALICKCSARNYRSNMSLTPIEEAIDALLQSSVFAPLLPHVDQAEHRDNDPENQCGDEDRLNGRRHRGILAHTVIGCRQKPKIAVPHPRHVAPVAG